MGGVGQGQRVGVQGVKVLLLLPMLEVLRLQVQLQVQVQMTVQAKMTAMRTTAAMTATLIPAWTHCDGCAATSAECWRQCGMRERISESMSERMRVRVCAQWSW